MREDIHWSQMYLCQMFFSIEHFENQGFPTSVKKLLLYYISKLALQLMD